MNATGYGVPRTSVSTFPTSSIRAPTLLVARANFQPLNRLPSINRLRPPPAYYPLSITYPPAITARAPPQEVVKTLPPVVRLPRQTFAQLNATRNPYVEPPRVALPQRTFAQIQVNPIADSPLPPKTFAQSLGVVRSVFPSLAYTCANFVLQIKLENTTKTHL